MSCKEYAHLDPEESEKLKRIDTVGTIIVDLIKMIRGMVMIAGILGFLWSLRCS
jgi:hypothetical protein